MKAFRLSLSLLILSVCIPSITFAQHQQFPLHAKEKGVTEYPKEKIVIDLLKERIVIELPKEKAVTKWYAFGDSETDREMSYAKNADVKFYKIPRGVTREAHLIIQRLLAGSPE